MKTPLLSILFSLGLLIFSSFAPGSHVAYAQGGDRLAAGQQLGVDQSITSSGGRFSLIMQSDGNLVLYQVGIRPLWASNTVGSGAVRAIMQTDGNFVLYRADNRPVWASNTDGVGTGAVLIMQNDGNLVIYQSGGSPIWASNTMVTNPAGDLLFNLYKKVGPGKHVETSGALRPNGQLDVTMHTWASTWFGGFHGCSTLFLMDAQGIAIGQSQVHRMWADGTAWGNSNHTDYWSDRFSADVTQRTVEVQVFTTQCPNDVWDNINHALDEAIATGKRAAEIIGILAPLFAG